MSSSSSSSNTTGGDHQKQKSQQQQPHQSQRTIPISSARRRLADGLLQEEMEIDPTLCVTTPTTIREFLSVLLDFGAVGNNDRRDSSSSKNVKQEQYNNSSSAKSSATAADSLQEYKQLKNEIQNQNNNNNSNSQKHFSSSSGNNEGRGVLSDDSSNFSKKCDEARVRSVVRSRQIIDETINRRKQQQEQFRKEHEMQRNIQLSNKNSHNEDAPIEGLTHYHHHHQQQQSTPENVLTLTEWKSIVRQHPALLKFSLDRAMSRSETTATAMISDLPVAILPAREKVLSATSSSSSTKRTLATSISNKTSSSSESDSDSDDENNSSTSQSDEKQRKLNSSTRENDDEEEKSYSSKISSLTQSGWSFASDYWQKGYQWLERFISGGIAGGVAKSVIAPGDRVKIIFQVNAELAFSIFAALNLGKEIVHRNGVFGLWAGHGATLLRVVPYASISFASFEFYNLSLRGHILNVHELETEIRNSGGRASRSEQKKLDELLLLKNGNSKENSDDGDSETDKNGNHHHDEKTSSSKRQIALRFICGALAGATATSATYPLDLLRARYAAHSLHSSGRPYASYFIGLKTIYQGEGLKALYSGLGPTLLGIVPYAGASFTVFETLKAFVLSRNAKLVREQQEIMRRNDENNNNDKDKKNTNNNNKNSKNSLPADEKEKSHELATWQRLSAGALSGLIAQSLTYPLDIVRRRMQVMPAQSKTMRETLKLIYKNEGFRGLYKGLTMNWVKGPIAVAVSFTINDWLKTRQQRFHAQTALLSAANGTDDDDHDNVDGDENIETISDNKEITNSNNKENLDAEGKSTLKMQKGEDNQQLTIMHTSRRKKNKNTNAQEEAFVNCDQDLKAIQMNEFLTEDEKKYAIQQKQIELHTSLSERFVIGALAGASAKIWTVPFDRLKLMMALGRVTNDGISPGHQFRTVLDLVLQTRNPFQGAAGQLLRVMPFAAVSYTMFDLCQPFSRRIVLTKDASFASDMIAGAAAAAVATVVAHPLDLVRSKFALAEKGGAPLPFSSYSEGIKILLNETKTNGFSSTLFHGLRPALAGVCPLAAFSFAIYHEGKRHGWAQEGDSFASRMMLGAGAGIIGQVASYPLNLVRRRAIAMAEEEVSESIANQLRAGLRGDSYSTFHNMYRRMPLGWSLGTMTLALSFAANDWMRDKLVEVRRKHATELLMRDPTM